jgi:Signal transduction histidine kinase
MPRGGSIRITAEQKEVAAFLPMSHGELVPGRYVCLAVIDSGRGFDESVARRLFEPFFTTRLAGTGLGLATVHEIVRDHDGAMNVQSKPEHGSRFRGLASCGAADSTAVVGPAVLPLGRGETVLVVESERERLLYDEEMLARWDTNRWVRAPADAIAACRSRPTGLTSSWSATPRKLCLGLI